MQNGDKVLRFTHLRSFLRVLTLAGRGDESVLVAGGKESYAFPKLLLAACAREIGTGEVGVM